MDKSITFKLLTTTIILLSLHPKSATSQWFPRRPPVTPPPLCSTQFALANSACAVLPYTPVPPPSPPSPPLLPPSPPDENGPYGGGSSRHGHHHRHGHGHRHGNGNRQGTPAEEECCRWLKEIDSMCVCDLLVHLPPFLTRPVHNYAIAVEGVCDVNFDCGSRLVQL